MSLGQAVEQTWHACRHHHHAQHLQHGEQAHAPVVGVVTGGEPGVADPAPAHRKHREQEADDGRDDMAFHQKMRSLAASNAEGDDQGQVVEQLQRGGSAMQFVEVTA